MILQVYQTEVDWLALVELTSGEKLTLKFDHQPSESEIATNCAAFEAPPVPAYKIEAENGAVV